jgi:hypothetical protein
MPAERAVQDRFSGGFIGFRRRRKEWRMRRSNTRLLIVVGILIASVLALHFFAHDWLSSILGAIHGGGH